MSRSQQEIRKQIANRYYQWDSEHAKFKYFDKSIIDDKNPKGTNVFVDLPFRFIVLDVLCTIKGWSDKDSTGIYSNEVKDLSKQQLFVKTFKGNEIATGLYTNIKDKVAYMGGKFASSVYIAYKEGGEYVIGNLQLVGASVGAFIEYCKKNPSYKDSGAIQVKTFTNEKKGATKYTSPVFEYLDISNEANDAAISLDIELQQYLKQYFENVNQKVSDDAVIKAGEEHVEQVSHRANTEISSDDSTGDMPF